MARIVTDYSAMRGARTGTTIWRAVSRSPEESISPDGVMDLMWFQDRFVVAGPDTRTMVAATRPGEATWGLQFAPGVAHALLGVPADELTDRRVELADLARLPRDLTSRVEYDVPTALEQVFVALWARADPDRATLRLAASLDRAARAGLTVGETARLHGVAERSLRRLSGTLFGYGPKTLMQIHRFQHAMRLANAGTTLAEAAATAGYADQSHFIRETRRLTGQTPSELTTT